MMIKEFCGGKSGWNDRVIFIETDPTPPSESDAAAIWYSQIYGKVLPKTLPSALPEILSSLLS